MVLLHIDILGLDDTTHFFLPLNSNMYSPIIFRPGFLFMLPLDSHKKFTWTFFEGKSEGQRAPDSHGALYIILAVKGGGRTALSCSVQALKQLIFALRMPLCQRQSSQVRPACSPADRRKGPLALAPGLA